MERPLHVNCYELTNSLKYIYDIHRWRALICFDNFLVMLNIHYCIPINYV
jgi:hypothetical protein